MLSSLEKNKKYINYALVLIYFLIHLFLLSKHEMWRDEAQAWLVAKNTSLFHLFKLLRVEGHPFLWFIIIGPLGKLGLPFNCLGYVSLTIMAVVVYFFLKNSPFPVYINAVLLFSSPFFYYNAVIARMYSLCVLISILICIYYKDRFEKPLLYMILVALLFQTHIKISGLAIGLCLEFLYNAIKNKGNSLLKYLLIPAFSFVFLILELFPYGSYRQYTSVGLDNFTFDTKMKLLRGFARIAKSSWGIENETVAYAIFAVVFVLIIIGIALSIKKKTIKDYINVGIVGICAFGLYYAVTAFVHGSHSQMATIFASIILVLCWILYDTDKQINKYISLFAVIVFTCLSISVGIIDAKKDVDLVYSYGKETSDYINSNLENDSVVLMTYNYFNPLVFSYSEKTGIQFYDVNHKRNYLFHQWSEDIDELSLDDVYECATKTFSDKKDVYYLWIEEINDKRFELAYSNLGKDNIAGENFALYRIVK